jgi:hypothetical protein
MSYCQKQCDNTDKIYYISRVNYTPAYAAIVKVDAEHFQVIVGTTFKRRYTTDCREGTINYDAQECTRNERYYCISGKAATANSDSNKASGQKNEAYV